MKRSSAWLAAVALSAGLCTAASAQVTGTVKFDGTAPKPGPVPGVDKNPQCAALHKEPLKDESLVVDSSGGIANVVVFLKGDALKGKGEVPKDDVLIDQKGCQYVPHVVSMTIGQKVLAANSDPFLHNVHTLPENNPGTNFAQPGIDKGTPIKAITTPEIIKTKCDVHPWMSAWIAAFDHPFHNVTIEDGTYEIDTKGLPDGEYEIVAWQEKLKESAPQKVTIKGGKAEANFSFKPKAAAADPKAADPIGPTVEVALKGDATAAGAKKECCENCEPTKAAKPADAVVAK